MPRDITPRPATPPVLPQVQKQHIDNVRIEAGLDINGDIDPNLVVLTVDVFEVKDDGTYAIGNTYTYPLAQWPASLRTDVLNLRNTLLTLGESLGILEPGTDSGEIT